MDFNYTELLASGGLSAAMLGYFVWHTEKLSVRFAEERNEHRSQIDKIVAKYEELAEKVTQAVNQLSEKVASFTSKQL